MATTTPTWVREAATGNGKPYVIWSLGMDPADPHCWARAVSDRLVTQPDGTLYKPSPWPRPRVPPPDVLSVTSALRADAEPWSRTVAPHGVWRAEPDREHRDAPWHLRARVTLPPVA